MLTWIIIQRYLRSVQLFLAGEYNSTEDSTTISLRTSWSLGQNNHQFLLTLNTILSGIRLKAEYPLVAFGYFLKMKKTHEK